jgi:hypothetical protein
VGIEKVKLRKEETQRKLKAGPKSNEELKTENTMDQKNSLKEKEIESSKE